MCKTHDDHRLVEYTLIAMHWPLAALYRAYPGRWFSLLHIGWRPSTLTTIIDDCEAKRMNNKFDLIDLHKSSFDLPH